MDPAAMRVTVWGENVQEQTDPVRSIYPSVMHTTIAEGILEHLGHGAEGRTATLDQPEHG
ncbi:MAG: trehalose utilization protein ThuA, partial [Chloroflexota bacterium]|nr:trehalose utilization protein ThuA [Chloroflexota bacterium]